MFSFKKKTSRKEDSRKKYLQNPKILEVNLIKDEARIFFDWNRSILILVVVLFLAGLFVMEIYLGLNWWEKQEIAQAQALNESVAEINREVGRFKEQAEAAVAYKEKSVAFSNLLSNHVYWTNFFSWLERNTLSTVQYSEFSGDLSGTYNLGAKASSFADVSWQVKAFLNDPLTRQATVELAEAEKNVDGGQSNEISFDLSLKVNPEIFQK
ncbi:TPA: hypothetical protein DCZ15_02230 [Candidatus Falkowbacteria bacterium]|nr:MAG: hypothetical protein UV95_C0001G0161 [Candidatus Falkowbacteria bacterium GW2011_GWF2_43_32]HBA36671.1 hypothetical protein [Candidatus Falkowbacteria bacterium]